eukprot:g6558.t1
MSVVGGSRGGGTASRMRRDSDGSDVPVVPLRLGSENFTIGEEDPDRCCYGRCPCRRRVRLRCCWCSRLHLASTVAVVGLLLPFVAAIVATIALNCFPVLDPVLGRDEHGPAEAYLGITWRLKAMVAVAYGICLCYVLHTMWMASLPPNETLARQWSDAASKLARHRGRINPCTRRGLHRCLELVVNRHGPYQNLYEFAKSFVGIGAQVAAVIVYGERGYPAGVLYVQAAVMAANSLTCLTYVLAPSIKRSLLALALHCGFDGFYAIFPLTLLLHGILEGGRRSSGYAGIELQLWVHLYRNGMEGGVMADAASGLVVACKFAARLTPIFFGVSRLRQI